MKEKVQEHEETMWGKRDRTDGGWPTCDGNELVVVIGSIGWQIWFTVGGDMIQEEVAFKEEMECK